MPLGMARVLVVEDEPTVRVLLSDVLEAWGHDVESSATGEEAIGKLEDRAFDVVLLDLMLGTVSGYDVLERMAGLGLRDRTRVVVLTARATEWDYMLGWMRGADDYLTKPFDPVHLQRVVDEMLASSPEELAERRRTQLEKSHLLYKLETTFHEDPGASQG